MTPRSAALAAVALAGCTTTAPPPQVELMIAGPPIAASETVHPFLYERPVLAEGEFSGGIVEQGWAMLGREDRAAVEGADEYAATVCPAPEGSVAGLEAVLDAIAERAAQTRVLIVNESHYLTAHREFSRRLARRLRIAGYTVFAAETFRNRNDGPDPVETHADFDYPHTEEGWYGREPVFGQLLRQAKTSGYRLTAYEQVYDPDAERGDDLAANIASREQAQAEHLAAILETMPRHEKLFVHVGYSHADEHDGENAGRDVWMAARLKRLTGVDPLTIGQTECRGGADVVRLLPMPRDGSAPFDYALDHPVDGFRHGRAAWRFAEALAVPIPEPFAAAGEPLVIEAFREGEPFDAVPKDRVYVEPGEDVRLALAPRRYTVRAVRLSED